MHTECGLRYDLCMGKARGLCRNLSLFLRSENTLLPYLPSRQFGPISLPPTCAARPCLPPWYFAGDKRIPKKLLFN